MFGSLKTKVLVAALAGGVLAASAASAATITVGYQGGSVFGSPNYSQSVRIVAPEHTGYVSAGPFRLNGSNGFGDFVAFCIDLSKHMANGRTYETAAASLHGAAVDDAIDRLFTSAYAGINSAVKGAAFQVALWEIITDTGSGYSLGAGDFRMETNRAVWLQATDYLNGLTSALTGGYKLTFLNSRDSQNLVTVSPVPVPAAAGMLGLGLASFFGLRRRKKA